MTNKEPINKGNKSRNKVGLLPRIIIATIIVGIGTLSATTVKNELGRLFITIFTVILIFITFLMDK